MPDIIKGTKRKIPVSGAGAYVDYGGSGVRNTPSLAKDVTPSSQDYQIGGIKGVRGSSSGSSSGNGSGTGGTGIGSKISGAVKDATAKVSDGTRSAMDGVQEEIKRRVSEAAQNVGTGSGSSGDGYSSGGTKTLPSQPEESGGYTGGSSGSVTDSAVTAPEVEMPEAMSYEDYWKKVGGDVYESELQKAIAARVQQAAEAYNRQKEQAGTSYEDAARQAYINNMLSQRNLEQQLAANGVYGGMADSQRIAMDSSYQNQVTDLERQYQETIADLEQAITDAKLAGDTQAAEQMAGYKTTVQSQYANYLLQKDQQAENVAQWQREYEAQLALQRQQAAQQAASDSGSYTGGYSSGGGYDNGGLTASQVAEMQRWYGASADGLWGSQSSAAAGGLTAAQAWRAYQAALGGQEQDNTSYGGAGVNRTSRM